MDSTPPPRRSTHPGQQASPDLVGETFDDFRILRCLGQGGMGQVYLAEQTSLKRKVAVKMLREDIAGNPIALERFKAESKTVAQLSHANVVQVHTFGEHEGRHYMVLEYVDGVNLRDYVLRKGPLDAPQALSIMRQVASALSRAGEMGIVHRDIKPENILLNKKGEAKVADFGLSRCLGLDQPVDLTRGGTTVGTPLYMSPEQVEGKAVDQRSDIYSFGVTCYQLLAGRAPFQGSTAFEVALKHVREEPPPLQKYRPDLPPALCAVVHKMMGKRRRDRYQSARDLLKDITRVRESLGGTTGVVAVESVPEEKPAPSPPPPARPHRRTKAAFPVWAIAAAAGGVGCVVLAVVIVGVAAAWHRPPAGPDPVAVAPTPTPAPTASAVLPLAPMPPAPQEREETLRKTVEQHLMDNSPNPAGVEGCIDLGVLYLDRNDVADAESLFARMDERRPPSAYHFVGRLGLAVTDALRNDYRSSQAKFMELFDAKSRDNRVQVLNDYLAKNPEFAKWVNEADSQNVRNGVTDSPIPPNMRHWPGGHFPFRKP